jgi:hypothetical protein
MAKKNVKEMLQKMIREELENHMIEESIVNWLLDKTSDFVKGHFNHVADYQYARLMQSPDFKALHKKFNMSEKDFMSKATKLIKQNPQKFADILAYDASKSKYKKFF